MNTRPQRWELWRHILGVTVCLAIGWFGIIHGLRIPVVADASYGFHEFGHLMTWFLPEVYRAMMGSLFQVLIPFGLAAYFLLFQRDLLAVALMLGWTGLSAHETSAYIADAAAQTIKISPYHVAHDWALALTELGRLGAADELAWIVQAFALLCVLVAMGVAALGVVHAVFEYENVEKVDALLVRPTVT
ncbi:hypothetical protein EG835_07910, partial [bacterium]|nr:hypothetical protein [bacterium]